MRIRLILLCLLLAWTLPLTAAATELDLSAPEPTATPRPAPALSGAPLLDAPPMTLNCAAALLLEPQSGQILFELNADAPRAVASFTTGTFTGRPSTSATIWHQSGLLAAPPANTISCGMLPVASFTSSKWPLVTMAVFSRMAR